MPGQGADVLGVMGGVGANALDQASQSQPDVQQELQRVTAQLQPLQSQLDQIAGSVQAIVTQFPIDANVASQFADAIQAAKKALTQVVMTVIKQAPQGPAQASPIPMG